MPAAQEPLRPPKPSTDQPWRKRSAQLLGTTAHQSIKRFRPNSSTSSGRTTGLGVQLPHVASSTRSSSMSWVKAERWFDETNEHPKEVSFIDDDPPYFMKNDRSDCNSVCATQSANSLRDMSKMGPTAPTRSLIAQMNADNDNGEAFRSVIDDLTIQNKKLKKKLKKYEALHCSHLQEEKLFEVRVHGLPANRKRELEETLRNFASSINEDSLHPFYPSAHGITASALQKSSSSSTSVSKRQGDSAYASMSGRAGGTSLAHLARRPQSIQANRQNIKSYLHGIPSTLALEQPVAMSDRSKSKAIVRRLEQIFTGKGPASRQYGQSQQQQEVSQSAALASNQSLDHEGTREAHILSFDSELPVDPAGDVKARVSSSVGSNSRSLQASGSGSPRSPEQRPTRPLDLDLHRAQIPSDNIEYLRRLAVSSIGDDSVAENKGGWVYLNLLTSMAQLHTLNVTPEFIRKAVTDFSVKFELSPDKTKIRWLGGSTGTKMSSEGDDSEDQTYRKPSVSNPAMSGTDEVQERLSARVHPSTEPSTAPETGAKRRPIHLNDATNEASSFHYKPLFFHAAISDEDGSDAESDSATSASHDIAAIAGKNSAVAALQGKVFGSGGRKGNDGPIIFYNKAKFCTDLSGDPNCARRRQTSYHLYSQQPVGSSDWHAGDSGDGDESDVKIPEQGPSESPDETASSVGCALNLDDLKSTISSYMGDKHSHADVANMEASGLGGIQPDDNFVVKVQVRHRGRKRTLSAFTKPKNHVHKVLHYIPRSSIAAFHPTPDGNNDNSSIPRSHANDDPSVNGEIISAVKTQMAPSALPPASYLHLPFSSSSGSDSDVEEYCRKRSSKMKTTTDYVRRPQRLPGAKPTGWHSFPNTATRESDDDAGSDDEDVDVDDDDNDDDSIDLLAHARGVEPETIAAREREFERGAGGVDTGGRAGGGGEGSDVDSMSVDGDESD